MSQFTTSEILERFTEGLRLASSRAREMYRIHQNKMWLDIAKSLDGIRENGVKMVRGKPLTENQVQELLDTKKAERIIQETRH